MRRRQGSGALLDAFGEPWVAAALLAALVAVLAARAATAPVDDPDVWWIAAAGRDLLATLAVPSRNAYSYTAPAEPWVMHEILFAAVYALGLGAIGPAFFPLFSLIAATAAITLAALAVLPRTRHLASAALALALFLAGTPGALFAPRPSHASLVFPLAMTALALRPGWSPRRTALAVAVEIAWTNTHGSFPLGLLILLAAAFGAGESRGRITAVALAGLGTLANPYGLRLHGLVESYLSGGDETAAVIHRHVVEFFPIWHGREPFVNPFNAGALVVLAVLAASALAQRRHVWRAALTLALVALGVYQVRHVTLAVVLGAVLSHAELDDLCGEAGLISRPFSWKRLTAAVVLPGLALSVLLWTRAVSTREPDQWIAADVGGAEAARLARELPDGARVFAPFQASGLLIWLGAPRGVRVFFDSRNDCYPAAVAEAAFSLEAGGSAERVSDLLERYGTEVVLAPASQPALQALLHSPRWWVRRRDGAWFDLRHR